MKESYSFKLKSHPDKLLKDHLNNVGEFCYDTLKSKYLKIDEFLDFKILLDISYIIGITHDIGKSTTFFQEYLNEEDESRKRALRSKPETHHGLLSALFTYFCIETFLEDTGLLEKKFYEYIPILSFQIVKKHHGNLENVLDEIRLLSGEDEDILRKQINSIDSKEITEIISILFSNLHLNIKFEDFADNVDRLLMREIKRKEKKLIRNLKKENEIFYYFINQLLYSILLNSDKFDVIFGKELIKSDERICISSNIVDRYKEIKGFTDSKEKINKIRNEIYDEVISQTNKLSLEDKVLSLNVPTGTGKTLTSLSFALKLRSRIEDEKGFTPRIIYSLPFLSIIDQNFDVFEDVFTLTNSERPPSNLLLKHHHLSDIFYSTADQEFETNKSLFLIEGWNSEIVVTTFVQFFHTIISNRNRALRKFHNITNSIVILDEIQAIPHRYWHLLKTIINFFAKHFNTYFIFVTATQPLIFDESNNEIIPLVGDNEYYFRQFDRIKLINFCFESINLEEFEEKLREDILENNSSDFLIVMNTINSSKVIYKFIKSLELKNTKLFYLSTNITPRQRLERIENIRRTNDARKIIVSTQLIEAGVDIDVDIVYRDLAPLDSINQVSGRCNRNYSDKKGIVKIFSIKDDKKEFYKYIYDGFLLDKTKEVLKEYRGSEIDENNFLSLNNKYFELVKTTSSKDESNKIISFLEKLEFSSLVTEFRLIEENYEKVDIFIELNENAKKIWDEYNRIISTKDAFERKNLFLKIKKKFYEYIISVDKNKVIKDPSPETGIVHIGLDELKDWYSLETGYKSPEGTILIF
jgi:CRISPR-associated endonuclease/helicase Cas3